MSEPDDRLENFIRKGLGQPEFAFREEDWALMEAKLAAMPIPVSTWTKLRWWILGSAFFFIAFFSGWVMNGWVQDHASKVANAEIPIENKISSAPLEIPQTKGLNKKEGAQSVDQAGSNSNGIETQSLSSNINAPNSKEDMSNPIFLKEEEGSPKIFYPSEAQALTPFDESANLHYLNKQAWSLSRLKTNIPNRKIKPNRIRPLAEEKKEDASKKQIPFHAALGLMISPDFTGTTIKKGFEYMGQTYGLGLEFYTGPKFRLKLSAIQTEKIYSAGKGEYTIPGSGYYRVEPERTDAVCDILEVPIFLQYNIWNQGRNSIWLSNGLSSYWMQREDYQYTYSSSGPYPESLSIVKENRHLFSVVSVGFAYERQLNKHLSLELEPYLKIPLGGVGYGKVSLYTTGAYFSIKYHLRR